MCGPDAGAERIAAPCDVIGRNTETVVVSEPGTITIVKRTEPGGAPGQFGFTASGQPGFSLGDGESEVINGLAPGTYRNTESSLPTGWQLAEITWVETIANTTVDQPGLTATVQLDSGEDVTCTFTNRMNPTPATPSTTDATTPDGGDALASTGPRTPRHLVPAAVGLILLGHALLPRRRSWRTRGGGLADLGTPAIR